MKRNLMLLLMVLALTACSVSRPADMTMTEENSLPGEEVAEVMDDIAEIVEEGVPAAVPGETVVYTFVSEAYGFTFSLPESWQAFYTEHDLWTGTFADGETYANGPLLRIKHPMSVETNRQDIPVMVILRSQWAQIETGELAIGAGGLMPTELGHNNKYVFALPARYNYAYPEGFEEVEDIIAGNPLSAFDVEEDPGEDEGYRVADNRADYLQVRGEDMYVLYENENDAGIELWRFSHGETAVKLRGPTWFSYMVAEDQSRIAFIEEGQLIITDRDGIELNRYDSNLWIGDEEHMGYLEIIGWQSDGQHLWLGIFETYYPTRFIYLDTATQETQTFDNELDFSAEFALDVNSGWIAYSNYPIHFDVDSVEAFLAEETTIVLRVYNLFNGNGQAVDKCINAQFQPEWRQPGLLYYHKDGLVQETYFQ